MAERETTVGPEEGIHGRPAAQIVKAAKGFTSQIVFVKGDREVNAKSVLKITGLARKGEKLTVRELIGRLGGGRGHRTFTGTPEQVADAIQHWFEAGAADGFNVMPPVLPSGLTTFVDEVIPILQRRGLFRTEYAGTTLREHYGLDWPKTAFAPAEAAE